ncbi:MAG TPA: hypothetical protein VFC54_07645 [Pseudolabrys sp.]|nr:hypothetical protein [Pseudolabrys sp.]
MRPETAQRHPSQDIPRSTHGLWSLWDIMLKQAALEFGRSLADLRLMAMVSGNSVNFNLNAEQINGIKIGLQDTLGNLKRIAILSDLNDAIGPELDRFQTALTIESLSQLSGRADHLRDRVQDELQNEWYFQVDRAEAQFYGKKTLFGDHVATKFKDAAYDIENAGNCLALQQPTACVFHLMRSMEVALRSLGTRLHVKIGPKDTIGKILNDITPKLNAMPDQTESQKRKKERWAEARANLFHVKQAWRDNSMHGKQRYDRAHAYAIFMAVRTFMAHLASL